MAEVEVLDADAAEDVEEDGPEGTRREQGEGTGRASWECVAWGSRDHNTDQFGEGEDL